MSATELQQRLGEPDLRIIDCRFNLMEPAAGRVLWLQGHIPGAVYADLDNDLAGPISDTSGRHPLPGVESAAASFAALGIGNDSTVVCYDADNGSIAARAWWLLRWLGHERVTLLDGGYASWVANGAPVEKGEVRRPAATLSASPHPERVISTAELEQRIRDGQALCLVDARAAARFRGEAEPIDSVAGHIPGALSLPFSDTLYPDGRFRPAAELRRLWDEVLADGESGDYSVMCGSGVTACHLVLSACLAGLDEPRLYVGSWSEWIRNPERPVVQGT